MSEGLLLPVNSCILRKVCATGYVSLVQVSYHAIVSQDLVLSLGNPFNDLLAARNLYAELQNDVFYFSSHGSHVMRCARVTCIACLTLEMSEQKRRMVAVPELRTQSSQRNFSVDVAAAEFDMNLWR